MSVPGRPGTGCPVSRAELAYPRRQVARAQEALVVRIDECREGRRRLGARGQLLVRGSVAGGPHRAPALLHQPQPHDVAQQADRAGHAALVGEVGGKGGIGRRPVRPPRARSATRFPTRGTRSSGRPAGRPRPRTRCRGIPGRRRWHPRGPYPRRRRGRAAPGPSRAGRSRAGTRSGSPGVRAAGAPSRA